MIWLRRLGRRALDCGCPRDGRQAYGCPWCNHDRCAEHRDDPHDCPRCPGCRIRHGYPLHERVGAA